MDDSGRPSKGKGPGVVEGEFRRRGTRSFHGKSIIVSFRC